MYAKARILYVDKPSFVQIKAMLYLESFDKDFKLECVSNQSNGKYFPVTTTCQGSIK